MYESANYYHKVPVHLFHYLLNDKIEYLSLLVAS